MDDALRRATHVLPVLSPAYLSVSTYGPPEWHSAWADDPDGRLRRIVPVRVAECRPEGLLRAVSYIDLVDLDERAASARLISGVAAALRGRAKPATAPPFPATPVLADLSAEPVSPGLERPSFPGPRPTPGRPVRRPTGTLTLERLPRAQAAVSVDFAPHGHVLAAAYGNNVLLADAGAGVVLGALPVVGSGGARHDVTAVRFSPDGLLVAAGTGAGETALYRPEERDPLRFLTAHGDEVTAIAFSDDSRLVATASADGTARVHRTDSGDHVQPLLGHNGEVTGVDFGRGRDLVATSSADATVRLWGTATGRHLAVLREAQSTGGFRSVSFSPDGSRVAAVSDDGRTCTWDVATRDVLWTLDGDAPGHGTAFSRDGAMGATSYGDGTVRLWEPGSGARLRSVEGPGAPVRDLSFSVDGAVLAGCADDGRISVWDTATGVLRHVVTGHRRTLRAISLARNGTAATGAEDGAARLWEVSTGRYVGSLAVPGPRTELRAVAFSADGGRLAAAHGEATVSVLAVEGGEVAFVLRGHEAAVHGVCFSPGDKLLATASSDGTARLWAGPDGRPAGVVRGHRRGLRAVSFSPDGTTLATASADSTARLWSIGGEPRLVLEGHLNHVNAVGFAPDGDRVVTASSDTTARVWWLGSDRAPLVLAGHGAGVLDAAFSPDGTLVGTASRDSTAALWETRRDLRRVVLAGHDGPVTGISFSPDGSVVGTVSADGTCRLWTVPDGSLVATLTCLAGTEWAAFLPDGTFKTADPDAASFWWRSGLETFRGRDLARMTPPVERLSLDAPLGRGRAARG